MRDGLVVVHIRPEFPGLVCDVLYPPACDSVPPERPHPQDPTREAPWVDDVLDAPYWSLWESSMLEADRCPLSGEPLEPDDARTDARTRE